MERNLKTFKKGNCRVLHLGGNNHSDQCGLVTDLVERSSEEKDLGVLVHKSEALLGAPCAVPDSSA